jgi:Tfp pilus assembly protein PilN
MARSHLPAIALDGDAVVLVDASGASRRIPIDPAPVDGTAWASLESALRQLPADSGSGTLPVALLAPWSEMRGVVLPPIDDRELTQLVARSVTRYFVGARGAQVIGISPRPRSIPTDAPRMVAATAARVLTSIESAARTAGWAGVRIVPAEAAWAAATSAVWPSRPREAVGLLLTTDERTTLVEAIGGSVTGLRRFRGADRDAALIHEHVRGGLTVAVVGTEPARGTLVRALAGLGVALQPIPEAWERLATDPAALAASHAGAARTPVLASATAVEASHSRVRRLVWQLGAVAALVLVTAAGVELWGAHRELAAVQAARREVRPAVEATLVGQSSLEEAYRRLVEVVGAERDAPRWSVVFADLAARVPVEAHLTGFRSRGDSLVVDGFAVSAAELFEALEGSPVLANVRASAPVRRQAPEGSDPTERFTIAAIRRPVRGEAP